jgi:hypothetical protein
MARTQKELTEIKLMFLSKPLAEIETWLKKQPTIGELQIVVEGWIRSESSPNNLMKLTSIKKKLADISGAQIKPSIRSGNSANKPLLGPGEWKQKNK